VGVRGGGREKAASWRSPVAKFLSEGEIGSLTAALDGAPGDLLLLVADDAGVAAQTLGALRLELAGRFGLAAAGDWKPVWVTNFPLVEWNDDEGRWDALHHPFTSPTEASLDVLAENPGQARARAYDVVINGAEIGGGSIRINRPEIQYKVLEAIGMSRQEADEKTGWSPSSRDVSRSAT
jgi:aspartyl-tRNA synthetase